MPEQTFLAWLVVIWRDEQRAVHAQFLSRFCVPYGVMRRVGTGAREHLTAFIRSCDRKPDQLLAFLR